MSASFYTHDTNEEKTYAKICLVFNCQSLNSVVLLALNKIHKSDRIHTTNLQCMISVFSSESWHTASSLE